MGIQELLRYADWSKNQLRLTIEAHADVWDREFETVSAYKSIHALIAHLASAEERWLMRILNRPLPDLSFDERTGLSIADVFSAWDGIRGALNDFVRTEGVEALSVVHHVRLPPIGLDGGVSVGQMLWQVSNHQTYHIGQISTALQRWSIDPPNFDVIVMIADQAIASL